MKRSVKYFCSKGNENAFKLFFFLSTHEKFNIEIVHQEQLRKNFFYNAAKLNLFKKRNFAFVHRVQFSQNFCAINSELFQLFISYN